MACNVTNEIWVAFNIVTEVEVRDDIKDQVDSNWEIPYHRL